MLAILKHTRTGFFVTMAGLLCLSVMTPVLTVASSDLLAGDDAIVTNNSSLRTDVGYTSDVLANVDAETPASILDGPLTDADGGQWYLVQVGERLIGYLPADALDPAGLTDDVSENQISEDATDASLLPWKEPIDFGVANADVICRDASSVSGAEIVVVASGLTVEITGEETWSEGVAWLPVNCAGVGGFISSEFITIDEQVTEEPAGQESTETTEPLTTTTTSNENTESEESADEPEALPWVAPIGFAVASESVICRGAPSTSANEITVLDAGLTVEITGDATTAEGTSWTPVNCAGVGGFVATDFLTAEAPEEIVDETTEEVVDAEAIVEDVNEAVNTEKIIDDVNDVANAETIVEDVNRAVSNTGASGSNATEETQEQSVASNSAVTTGNVETDEAETSETQELVDGVTKSVNTNAIEQEVDKTVEDVTENVESASDDIEQTVEDVTDSVETIEGEVDQTIDDVINTVEEETIDDVTEDTELVKNEVDQLVDGVTESVNTNLPSNDELDEALKSVPSVDDIKELATADLAVTVDEAPSASPVEDWQILGTAEVKGAGEYGLACSTSADSSASVIAVLPEGMSVMVLTEPDADGWMSIVCGDQVGFADSEFLWSGGAERLLNLSLSSIATVSGTGGGGLNCRSAASINASVIAWFPEGSAINARGGPLWGWVPVVCGGQDGWVFADYLRATGATVGIADAIDGNGNSGGSARTDVGLGETINGAAGTSTGTVTVTGTGGANLNCRTGAGTGSSIITSVRAGSTLSTRGAASGGWQPVTCAGVAGFVSTMYVTAGSGSGSNTQIPTPDVDWDINIDTPASNGFANGDHARVTANLNLRYEPSGSAGIATYAPAGTVVAITGSHAGNGYYPVNWDGLRGYMHGDFLAHTDQAVSERGGSARTDVGLGEAINSGAVSRSGGGSTATGNAIVDFAMGYIGYPYVWATAGPYSFDCSGFTNWVIKNVVGPDIGRGLWTQVSAGTSVSRSNLQPGDLVFHQNTYKPGLSHVGIYIGDNQMVNALNADAGVVVSDITSDYWESRWYGAVRIT